MEKFDEAISVLMLKLQRADFWIEFGTITKYDRMMKTEFDKVCDEIISTYPDYRSHMIKTAKKSSLADAILTVGERTKEQLLREIQAIVAKRNDHQKSLELKSNKRLVS